MGIRDREQEQEPVQGATLPDRLRALLPAERGRERGLARAAMPLAKLAAPQASRAEQAPGLDQARAAMLQALLLALLLAERERASGQGRAGMPPEQVQTLTYLVALEQAMGQDMAAPSSRTHLALHQTCLLYTSRWV